MVDFIRHRFGKEVNNSCVTHAIKRMGFTRIIVSNTMEADRPIRLTSRADNKRLVGEAERPAFGSVSCPSHRSGSDREADAS